MSLYNCKTDPNPPNGFRVTKFDADLNPEASYSVTNATCTCPAGVRPTCRHRKMLGAFLKSRHIDDEWFYHFEEDCWIGPAEPTEESEVMPVATEYNHVETPPQQVTPTPVGAPKLWRRV